MRYLIILILLFSLNTTVKAPHTGESPVVKRERAARILKELAIKEEVSYLEQAEFSPQNLIRYMELSNVEEAEVVLRQAILETGWFKSSLLTKGNNIFGMRVPKVRETLANGSYLNHAAYKHWTDSVKDYILWQQYWKEKGKSTDNYYNFLSNIGYATASGYITTLKYINLERLA